MTPAMRAVRSALLAATFGVGLLGCGASSHAPVEPAPMPLAPAQTVAPRSTPVDASPPSPDPMVACTSPDAHFADARRAPRPLTEEQRRALDEAEVFIHEHRGVQEREMRAHVAEYELHRARTFFEANHWGEAAVAFRALAMNHADADSGVPALQLFLDSLNVLGSATDPPRAICYEVMARDVPTLTRLYCEENPRPSDHDRADACLLLHKVQRDLDRLEAQKLIERADKTEGGDAAAYEQAGDAYMALAHRCISEAHAAHKAPIEERCDEIAYNGGRAFMAAKKMERARDAAQLMTEPANGMKASVLTAKLVKLVKDMSP